MIRYIRVLLGTLIFALSFNIFLAPDSLAATGVSGLSLVVNHFVNIDTSIFILVVNTFLILLSFIFLGKDATIKTILGSLLVPIFMKLTSNITSYIDISGVDLLIKSIIGGITSGYGLGLVFKSGYTTGGTDIIDAIVVKYLHMSMDNAIIMVDGIVVLLSGCVFGLEHLIYAIIILVLIGNFSNRFMLGINDDKVMFITSDKYQEIKTFLTKNYHYGITMLEATGGFSMKKRKVLMVSIRFSFYVEIRDAILAIDPDCFISVCDSYETVYINKERRKRQKKLV